MKSEDFCMFVYKDEIKVSVIYLTAWKCQWLIALYNFRAGCTLSPFIIWPLNNAECQKGQVAYENLPLTDELLLCVRHQMSVVPTFPSPSPTLAWAREALSSLQALKTQPAFLAPSVGTALLCSTGSRVGWRFVHSSPFHVTFCFDVL